MTHTYDLEINRNTAPDNNPVHEAVEFYWGARCPDHEEGCPVCEAWEQYDNMADNKELTMNILTLYIVDHWMPFPSSEYGGVQCVVAHSDAECERILAESVDEYYRKDIPNYRERIANEIKKAKRFPVDAADVGIVHEFLT